uniref:Uncharacterized protein n=1 Tax=Caenorhabditis tropicalis TaxID=1561998 RepID=A0A1I7UVE7_9PELO
MGESNDSIQPDNNQISIHGRYPFDFEAKELKLLPKTLKLRLIPVLFSGFWAGKEAIPLMKLEDIEEILNQKTEGRPLDEIFNDVESWCLETGFYKNTFAKLVLRITDLNQLRRRVLQGVCWKFLNENTQTGRGFIRVVNFLDQREAVQKQILATLILNYKQKKKKERIAI